MALPTQFDALTQATGAELDNNFQAVGILTTIPCLVTGTNALTFTQAANTPTISAYSNYLRISGVVVSTNTGAATARVGSLTPLAIYKDTGAGPVALTGAEMVAQCAVTLMYDGALGTGAGGWHLLSAGGAGGLSAIPNDYLLANLTGAPAIPSGVTLSALLSASFGGGSGQVLVEIIPGIWGGLNPGTAGNFIQSQGAGNPIAYRGAAFRADSNITATGSMQSDAYALFNPVNLVTTTAANTGVMLPQQPQAFAAVPYWIFNQGGATLHVYPPSGYQINALGVNNPDTIGAGAVKQYMNIVSGSQWWSW